MLGKLKAGFNTVKGGVKSHPVAWVLFGVVFSLVAAPFIVLWINKGIQTVKPGGKALVPVNPQADKKTILAG